MPFDSFQNYLYDDYALLCREDPRDRDATGNLTGVRQITAGVAIVSVTIGVTTYEAMQGKLHSTHNFDTVIDGAATGQKKSQNIDTSDCWCTDPAADIRTGDYMQLLTTMPGQWRRVAGISNVRRTIFCNYTEVFLSLCSQPPAILVSGAPVTTD